jgi:hypothetical protein
MDTKQLPAHPSLEQYKKKAKDLLKNLKSANPDALQRLKKYHPRLGKHSDSQLESANLALADAQVVIAREHGFESWPRFAEHIEGLSRKHSPVSRFEAAVDAVVTGDEQQLEQLLGEHPELIRERSMRAHHATLLNYVGANGVEHYRQKTPKNTVRIAQILLRAGADVHAVAELYGGSDTLGLAATSVFPSLAGVQEALIDVLVQHGASINEARLVNGCLANGRGRAATHIAKLGGRLDLEGAAGVGRLELVKTFFNEDGSLKTLATQKQMENGFMWACEYGWTEVVEFLLNSGMGVDAAPRGETGLHWAAYGAHVDIVRRLLGKKSPVEIRDQRFGSTPLEWALHAWNDPPFEAAPDHCIHYYQVIALLSVAGAKIHPERFASRSGAQLLEKMRADPRMVAALQGEMSAQ